jgi:hypothetical protein
MRMTNFSRRALVWAAAAGLVFLAAAPVAAQTTSASIFGQVKDSQGGVLPGAAVTLTSRTQAFTMNATTDNEGRFLFPIVRPDLYALKVSLEGFKTLERTNVQVNANDKFSAGILTLEVGAITEEVSVTGRVSELQTTSGERAGTLESSALTNIAINGRNLFNFATLVPGAIQNGTAGSDVNQVSSFTVNGQRPNSNNMTIDGVANIDTGDNGGNMAQTNIDSIAEFKLLTNAYSAEYGRAVGGQLQVVTKSGTQSFHGSGYWYGRRGNWNANTWTNNRAGNPRYTGDTPARNDSGYTIGGPIYIPGVFNKEKKKLFFFWSQEFQRRSDPVAERLTRTPTELERLGDFSQSVDNNGNPMPWIWDHSTNLPCEPTATGDHRGCFQYQGVMGRIDPSRLWQPGLNALNVYPLPNTYRGSGLNYASQKPSSTPVNESMLRIDFQPTDKWRVTGRFMKNSDTQQQAYGTTWAGAGSGGGTNGGGFDDMGSVFIHPGRNWMLSTTGILSNTMSLELSVGSARNSLDWTLGNPKMTRAGAGLGDFPSIYPSAIHLDTIPDMRFNGGRVGGNAGYYQTNLHPFSNVNETYDAIANLTKIWGAHNAKFGVYFQHSYKAQSAFASHNTQIDFIDDSANPLDTNFGYANAALGVFRTFTQASKYAKPEYVYTNVEWYAQDNWKVSNRLTVEAGVRFYALTPQWDESLQVSTFLPDRWSAADAPMLYQPACIGAYPCSGSNRIGVDPADPANTVEGRFIGRLVQPTTDAQRFNGTAQPGQDINNRLYSGTAFKVSPRLGVVYDLTGEGKMIVRGGFGIFYDRPQGNTVFNTVLTPPSMLNSVLTWGNLQDLAASGGDPYAPLGGMQPTAYDFIPPRVIAWNVGMQRKLAHALVLDIAYVGSKSDDLLEYDQINALAAGTTFKPENQDPTRAPSSVPGASAKTTDILRPYQGYGSIQLWQNSAWANYNALQAGLTRRFDKGLMFSVFYVWSKNLTTADSDWGTRLPFSTQDQNKAANYSYGVDDRPHNFVANFIYQTPNVAKGVLGVLANEWQISGIYRLTSGRPYAINYSVPGYNRDTNIRGGTDFNARVILTCDPGKGSSSDPYQQINTSCFAPPTVGGTGYESSRYFLHSPPINQLDLSLSKSFSLKNRVRLEVRLDAFNALNKTQFTGVNNSVSFKAINDSTVTNLPYDSNGNLVNQNGFGTINGVAPPRTLQLMTRLTF